MPTPAPSPNEDPKTRVLGSSTPLAQTALPPIDMKERLGRYLPIGELGRGGMGRVVRAYDPKLQREVALKVLHMELADPAARARMVREARTMARLNHPHVVAVYDAEEDLRHGVVLVMELVKGSTLQEWLRQRPRSSAEILEAFVEAGRGLAAAHAEGLLHRDFKPANVLVAHEGEGGARGPFKVTDFGLAKHGVEKDGQMVEGPPTPNEHPPDRDVVQALTEAGTVMGTPLYMAPEQHRGATLTSAADQYAFCVALWQALVGTLPFAPRDLVDAKHKGPPAWPRTSVAPRAVGEALRRGLAVEPEQRWPSMAALLEVLAPRRKGHRRRSFVALGMMGGIGLVTAAWRGSAWLEQRSTEEKLAACTKTGALIETTWNDDTRTSVREALLATNASYAATTAERLIPWLDYQAASWGEARVEACTKVEVHGTWDTDTFARASWCLEERRVELASLVKELEQGDADIARIAVDAASQLPRVAPCLDESVIQNLPPPPPHEQRADIASIRDDLMQAILLDTTGQYEQGLMAAQRAKKKAQTLGWPPLEARAMVIEGKLLYSKGAYTEAEQIEFAAFARAIETSTWDVACDAGHELVRTVGIAQARLDEGRLWARLTEASSLHVGDPLEQRAIVQLLDIAGLHDAEGNYSRAKELYERALILVERSQGSAHPDTANVLNLLAAIHSRLGDHQIALTLIRRALKIIEGTLGPNHPDITSSLVNLANEQWAAGYPSEARASFERALSIHETALGPSHPGLAFVLEGYATLLMALGDYDRSQTLHERALSITETALDPEHPRMVAILNNIAGVHLAQDEPDQARALYARALSIGERTLGPSHPEITTILINMADLEKDRSMVKPMYERALSIMEGTLGLHHPELATPLLGLAEVALEKGQSLVAVMLAERAVSVSEHVSVSSIERANTLQRLAKILWDVPEGQGRDRERAVAIMRQALAEYKSAGTANTPILDVELWLVNNRLDDSAHP